MDILNFQYKIKDGEIKPKGKEAKTVPFVNISFKIHTDGEKLYLTEMENKYGFDISELKRIRIIKERGAFKAGTRMCHLTKASINNIKL